MPRDQAQFYALFERMRPYAHIAERTPGNIGGIFCHGHRPRLSTHRPTQGNLLTTYGTTIYRQLRPLHSWLRMAERPRGRKTPGPDLGDRQKRSPLMQAMALMGSAGQPAESDFDSGTDTDMSSDDEAAVLD
eukprot:7041516-Pyramimonas_sp.AAC.1